MNLVNSEAAFLVNKAAEQFVQCLALEVRHLPKVNFQVLSNDFISGKQLHGREENTSRQVTSFCNLYQLVESYLGICFLGTFPVRLRVRTVSHFLKGPWKTDMDNVPSFKS